MTQVRRIPSRADGIANREKLLDAAETYFAQHGLDAPLHGVAELAGVGTGTLYRNFASQDELVEALFERIDSTFAKVASEASAQRNGWRALETFLRQTVAFLVDNPATSEIIRRQADNDPVNSPAGRAWVDPVEEFVALAKAEGSARPDLTGQDLAAAPLALGSLQNFSPDERTEIAARMVTLMLDGMRAHPHAPTALPVGADQI
ncbi:MAG: TetR/AcrR family transcriptional regulator [Actinomycetales bacterium]|nr:TetR/AcrR family transcriptional regulator [Actinomycetales bacterium]